MIRAGMMLRGPIAAEYYKALEELNEIILHDEAWNKDAIADLLDGCIAKVLEASPEQRSSVTQDQAKKFIQELKRTPEMWDVRHEVFGILPDCAGVEFGLLTFGYENVRVETAILSFPHPPSEHPTCFANISVNAINSQAAIDRAGNAIDQHLAVLNTLCAQFVIPNVHVSRIPEVHQSRTAYSCKGHEEAGVNTRFVFHNLAFLLSRSDLIAAIERSGGRAVDGLLKRKDTFADRLISAYEIAGAACVQRLPHLSFLLFAIALESAVLGRNTKSELSFQLGARVAHLQARSIDSRRELSNTIDNLYDLRSKIVHTAKSEVSADELRTLTIICLSTLHALAAAPFLQSMKEASELEEWFEKRLLGDPEPLPEW